MSSRGFPVSQARRGMQTSNMAESWQCPRKSSAASGESLSQTKRLFWNRRMFLLWMARPRPGQVFLTPGPRSSITFNGSFAGVVVWLMVEMSSLGSTLWPCHALAKTKYRPNIQRSASLRSTATLMGVGKGDPSTLEALRSQTLVPAPTILSPPGSPA